MTKAIVTVQNGKPMTSSRDVAELFGRKHNDVLRAIDGLECSPSFLERNFAQQGYEAKTGFGSRTYRSMNMTKDGFVFLVMGFTGKEAARFKEAYITRFNEMEARPKSATPALPDFSNPVLAARAWADEVEQKQALQIENQKLVPLATVGARAVSHNHTLNRFIRTLPGVNTLAIKKDLLVFNYLRKSGTSYRVRAAPIVTLKGTQAFAHSRDVAEFFGKEHKHVLRDIDVLMSGGPDLGHLFQEHAEYHDKARKLVRAFDMTKDGFTLLAMSFTGGKALQFKLGHPTKPLDE